MAMQKPDPQGTWRFARQGVMLAPGSIFAVDRQMPVAWTRLNVAYLDDPAFRRSLIHLGLVG